MDCSNTRSEPPSTGSLLYQQVREQSSHCDVIIKVGSWEKRFHWCVLVASPFFETIYRNPFLEKQRGIIELNKWPASLVEQSLLFLYGMEPDVTEANVGTLLDIAEFLLVPELKVACIDFLTKTEVTLDNCMQSLELSSVYGFELETSQSFIRGHLPEVLEQEGMLNATTESMKMLLGDPTLRYVRVQNWFNFIIRWVKAVEKRQCRFVELFHMLELSDCDSDFINNIVVKETLVKKNKEQLEKELQIDVDDHDDTVLIFKTTDCKSLTCLNLRTMLWYRVDIATHNNKDTSQFRHEHIIGVKNERIIGVKNSTSSNIYQANTTHESFSVLTHDLSNAHSSVSNVVISDTGDNVKCRDFEHYSIANDMLAAVYTKTGRNAGCTKVGKRRFATSRSIPISTLYIGKLIGPNTEMHAILKLRNHAISEICCGDNGFIAMLSCDRHTLFIFNEPTGKLESIKLKPNLEIYYRYHAHLEGFRDGFILYNQFGVVCISRLSGASLTTNYLVKPLTWEKHDASQEHQYMFDGDRWFRFRYQIDGSDGASRLGYGRDLASRVRYGSHVASRIRFDGGKASLEYVSHNDLTRIEDTTLLPWKNIPLPSKAERVYSDCRDVFAISLPKGITRCHLDCPHCIKDDQPQRTYCGGLWDDSYYLDHMEHLTLDIEHLYGLS